MKKKASWQSSHFAEQDTDPLTGFANIMDVMLVFALGLMLALIAQSNDLREHFSLDPKLKEKQKINVTTGNELVETPESIKNALEGGADGMQSMGQVYKDPKTGKLILIQSE
ncbi:MAG TPA: DUF2149 domain-containing protein [Leucothrix sp.]|nr:DUF2149 domain-containing protein [Leucothrix sp.]